MLNPFSTKTPAVRPLLLLATLLVLGFVGNFFALRLVSGFNYLFGSIAVMLILGLFGPGWSVLGALLASSGTIALFGHPYAMIWLSCEALFVALFIRRGTAKNLVLYDALYWLLIGAPLIWIFFQHAMQTTLPGTIAAILMYWIVGMTNALVASLILTAFPRSGIKASALHESASIPIQTLMFNLLMAIAAIPGLVVMILYARSAENVHRHNLYDNLADSSRNTSYELRLALLNPAIPTTSDNKTILQKTRIQPFHQITLLDRTGRVQASTDNSHTIGSLYDPLKNGVVRPTAEHEIVQLLPAASSYSPFWQQESRSLYIHKTVAGNDAPWVLVTETPFAPYYNLIIRDQINAMLFLLLFNLLALGISIVSSRRLTAPLRILSQATTDLPERLMREKISSWPASRIKEIDQLIENFRNMSTVLNHRFQEITYINETLEMRVLERTKQLSKTNDELQKEIVERHVTEGQLDHLMEELIHQVRFLQTLINAIPNPIFYKDINGRYQGCNLAFEEKWGLSREGIIGKTAYDLFPRQNADFFDVTDRQLYTEGGVQVYETQLRYADNLLHSVIFYKAAYLDATGKTAGLVGTIIDITDRKKAETERDRLMIELRQKNKELEGIVYVASHDLRSPLVNVQGFSRRLAKSCNEIDSIISGLDIPSNERERLRPILSVTIPKSLGYITGSIEKMDSLLNGLLRLSRLGRAAICFEQLDMQSIVSKIIESLTFQIETANATVEVGDLVSCLADAIQMTQVFSNLLDNAIKYRSKNRALLIRVSSDEFVEGVRYCVEDNGIGIQPDQQDKIWEIFSRLDPNGAAGEGLGLTMARRIIDRLGGSIWVESEPDVGSRFYVVMPKQQKLDA